MRIVTKYVLDSNDIVKAVEDYILTEYGYSTDEIASEIVFTDSSDQKINAIDASGLPLNVRVISTVIEND